MTPELMDKVLEARRYFRDHLPERHAGDIAFFDPTRYNEAITIQENVIFGKIAYGQAQAPQRIAELITDLLDQLELRRGHGGRPRSPAGIGAVASRWRSGRSSGRARLVKRPDLLVLYDPWVRST